MRKTPRCWQKKMFEDRKEGRLGEGQNENDSSERTVTWAKLARMRRENGDNQSHETRSTISTNA